MINLNNNELYFLMIIVVCCSIGNAIYCICCKTNNKLQYSEIL